jgi:hypothetical protein
VPTTGLLKPLRITSAMVSNIKNVRLIPAITLRNRLILFVVFNNPSMNAPLLLLILPVIRKGKGYPY